METQGSGQAQLPPAALCVTCRTRKGQQQGGVSPCAATSGWELNSGQPSAPEDLAINTKYVEDRSSTGCINPLVQQAATLE